MNLLQKIKSKIKYVYTLCMLSISGVAVITPAFASISADSAEWTGSTDINEIIGSILGMILALAQGVGIILLIFGIFRLVLASKDGNSNEQAQGIQLALVGAFLAGLRALLIAADLIS